MKVIDKIKLSLKNLKKLKRSSINISEQDAKDLVRYVGDLEKKCKNLEAKIKKKSKSPGNVSFDAEEF